MRKLHRTQMFRCRCTMRIGKSVHGTVNSHPQWCHRFSLERGVGIRQLHVARRDTNRPDWWVIIVMDVKKLHIFLGMSKPDRNRPIPPPKKNSTPFTSLQSQNSASWSLITETILDAKQCAWFPFLCYGSKYISWSWSCGPTKGG